jgi:iron complex outermembrane receptor protein
MSFKKYSLLMLCILAAAFSLPAFAQTEHPQTWAQDLAFLKSMGSSQAAAQQGTILRIRFEVELWLKLHPDTKLQLPLLPSLPLGSEQAALHLMELQRVVETIVQLDPTRPFHLGVTEVEVSTALSPLSPTAESITQEDIQLHDAANATKAMDLLPGVEIQHISGNRNEAAFMIRGFSSNGQVPLYLDGIPIYVPYDGYIDMSRFVTSDLAEIQVARGFSSPLLGPNALGGTVNLVTREPLKKYEGDAAIGTFSGNGLLSSLRLGTRGSHYLAQGTLDWLQNDFVPLSGNFKYPAGGYAALTPGNPLNTAVGGNVPYALTDHENQSYTRDEMWGGRVGWLPHGGDEYVFSYINQKGQKGVPLYQGANAAANFRNFWKWPYWNKDSYYFLSNTGIGEQSSIKFRVFYDQFRNSIDMYDNSSYNSMNSYKTSGSGSEISQYDDHTDGTSSEFTTHLLKHNVIGASFFFKDDTHNERGVYPGAATVVPGNTLAEFIPVKHLRDQQASFGLQDEITFTSWLHATVGFSGDHLEGLRAETYNALNQPTKGTVANTLLLPYECASDPKNTSSSGCTAHFWNFNPQTSATFAVSASDLVFVTFEDRGRFPTLKQRYSSGMGSALPNPELQTEHSRNWNFGWNHTINTKLTFGAQLFRSDLRNAIESALVPDPAYNPVATPTNPVADPKDLLGLCPSNNSVGHCSQNVNIGKETHEGVEIEVRSRPISWMTLDTSYTYLNRQIGVATLPSGTTLSSPLVLPTGVPKNKAIGTASFQLPRRVIAVVSARYEGGVTLQDTTYASTSPLYLPHGEVLATADLGLTVPVRRQFKVQAGVKNLFDRNYFYTAGYPEEGRNWFLNLRYQF